VNLEIRHLKLVAAVADEGGLTKAARRLNLTQSALSHQLRDAEQRLGTPLFVRLNKRMLLTQAGERLLAAARTTLAGLERAEDDIRQIALSREGALRIATQCYPCYHWLPGMLEEFERAFPRVEVRVVVEATQRPFLALVDGKLDLAVVYECPPDARLAYQPLFRDELVVVVHPGHPLAARPYVRAADFAAERLIMYSASKEENLLFQRILMPAGVEPAKVFHVQLTEAILELVKSGFGVAVLARWAVAPYVAAGELAAVPLTRGGFERQWSAATLRGAATPAYTREFVKLLAGTSVEAPAGAAPAPRPRLVRAARSQARR
jgi:LysR family transcriptional regulator for metE and metH